MEIEEKIEDAMHRYFNISYIMPAQSIVITRIMENERKKERCDSITVFPTGMGKSLCFMLPAVLFYPKYTILTYPLLSLMNDQARRLESAKIPYALIKGGMDRDEKRFEIEKLRDGKAAILITNPESLIILKENGKLDFMIGKIELFVIDEAHTAITWAESFRPALRKLKEITEYYRPHQRLCFSATCDDKILSGLVNNVLCNKDTDIIRLSPDRSNIFYASLKSLSKRHDVLNIITDVNRRPALVFCNYRNEAKDYHDMFKDIIPSFYYHAGLGKEEKTRIENLFYNSDDAVLFATNAYGMGVDKKNIRTVIHLHAPDDAASFLQEAGRGGRDGKEMLSMVLYSNSDEGRIKYVFEGKNCIRHSLLSLMGESADKKCLSCSHCVSIPIKRAGEKEILNLIARFPLLLTKKSVARILALKKLKNWKVYEIERAIAILLEERMAEAVLGRLYPRRRRK